MVYVMRVGFFAVLAILLGLLIARPSTPGFITATFIFLGSVAGAAIKDDRNQAAAAACWIGAALTFVLFQLVAPVVAGFEDWVHGGFIGAFLLGAWIALVVSIVSWPAGWLLADLRAFVNRNPNAGFAR